ncbi:hypothetical protein X777_13085 [Ooceraea biroi]|uniref:Uncharacterized protein n=1 Tax=Ooceraea biroi TaxID=2015173 RepID=A0A026WYG4_OOCBI|nr:hypothetical protein X777_13085 [Ooceraea biroi]
MVPALVLDITLPSLYMTVSGSILTIAPYDRRPPTQLLNVSLTFCSTCGGNFPFHPPCDAVSPTRSPVPAVRALTTATTMKRTTTMWSERKRTERTSLAEEPKASGPAEE